MKITLPKEVHEHLTMHDITEARKIISQEKTNTLTATEAATMIGQAVIKYPSDLKVLEASAEIAGNCRVWNYYTDDSRNLDVWVNFRIRSYGEYIEGGAYLSDVFQLTGDDDSKRNLEANCFLVRYTRAR